MPQPSRRRLLELRQSLEVEAPVYLMVTKADLLAGFTEYFADLDFEGRRAVLGATLPFKQGRASADDLAKAFDRWRRASPIGRPSASMRSPTSCAEASCWASPRNCSLRSRLMRLIDGAFLGGDMPGGVLRGFYFTSGVQEGAPLDRILSSMADVYDRPAQPSPAGAGGKAYFLNRLMTEVMFAEPGLVRLEPKAHMRQRVRLSVCHRRRLTDRAAYPHRVDRQLQRQPQVPGRDAQCRQMQRSKDEAGRTGSCRGPRQRSRPRTGSPWCSMGCASTAPWLRGVANEGTPLRMRFGLFQSGLAASGNEAYREELRRIMLPRLLLRLEKVLQANRQEPANLYEPLKVYLMLGGQGPMDRSAVRKLGHVGLGR